MESYSSELTAFKELELSPQPLISGLPDDIALFCMTRVPLKYHAVLKCVSKRWRNLVCSEEWHFHRRKLNLEESLIYALCRDKTLDQVCCYVLDPSSSRRSWKLIQSVPAQCFKRKGMAFQTLGKNLYLLGGCSWSEDATDEVYCYDPSSNSWSTASPLPGAILLVKLCMGKSLQLAGWAQNRVIHALGMFTTLKHKTGHLMQTQMLFLTLRIQ